MGLRGDGAPLLPCKDLTSIRGAGLVRAGPDTGPCMVWSSQQDSEVIMLISNLTNKKTEAQRLNKLCKIKQTVYEQEEI